MGMAECKDCVKNVTCVERRYFGGNQKNCKQFLDLNKYVEVVRCKDCKFYLNDTPYCQEHKKGYCEIDDTIKDKMHFCSYGERREGE